MGLPYYTNKSSLRQPENISPPDAILDAHAALAARRIASRRALAAIKAELANDPPDIKKNRFTARLRAEVLKERGLAVSVGAAGRTWRDDELVARAAERGEL
jgi:hypothetical protein